MAIPFELLVLLLLAYAAGLAIGWVVWSRAPERRVADG
jgi:hypothetical protein